MNPADILEALTPERATYWSKAGKWTQAQAVALMKGFEPLLDCVDNQLEKAKQMQIATWTLLAEIRRQSADPLPDTLTPREWIQRGLSAGYAHPMILEAVTGKATTGGKELTRKQQAMKIIEERADDIYKRIAATSAKNPNARKPSNSAVADGLVDAIRRETDFIYNTNTIEGYLRDLKWKPPKPD